MTRWFAVLVLALVLSLLTGNLPIYAAGDSGTSDYSQDRILVKFQTGTDSIIQKSIHSQHGGNVISEIPQIGVLVVKVPSGQALNKAAEYRAEKSVNYAEPDGITQALGDPNDPYYINSTQWGLANIHASDAWNITTGSSAVTIAVLDTGIDSSHGDLSGKVTSAVNFSSSSTALDIYGHGTHVAGIAAAATNNSLGVAGLGYNSTLMNVKVMGDDGSGDYAALIQGITWAADHGAKVINMSLGGTSASASLENAINYAWNKGVVVVAAAGNNANSTPFYPAYYSNVIAVAATDQYDQRAVFSNYGDWVDVGAPGRNIYSTIPSNSYQYMSGTSMASPMVAGLSALVMTTISDTNLNGQTNDEARTCILNGAERTVSGIGSGRINAYNAVTCTPPTTGNVGGTVRDTVTGSPIAGAIVTAGDQMLNRGILKSSRTDALGNYVLNGLPTGNYTLQATATGYTDGSLWTVGVQAPSTSSMDLNLKSTGSGVSGAIAGTVKDASTGNYLANASVTDGTRSTVTDINGNFSIPGVPAGTYAVTASVAGYTSKSQTVNVAAGTTTSISFSLSANNTGTIAGTVTDSSTGKPIAGANVTNGLTIVSTDINGAFNFVNIPYGTYTVTASKAGYTTASQMVSVSGTTPATVNLVLTPIIQNMWVNSLQFKPNGTNLRVTTNIAGDTGVVPGASVSLKVINDKGKTWNFSGKTDTYGNVTFTISKATSGTYTASTTGLIASGYTWTTIKGTNSSSYIFKSSK
jgi:thermitase